MPNLRSFTTSCVCLELRSLPSTGITRLQRYYEPLRHPKAPGPSLAGVRLFIPEHAMGLPVLRAFSLCTCCRHYPGAATGVPTSLASPAVSAFPERVIGSVCASTFSRLARRSLALRPAHSRCHQIVTCFTRRLQPFRYLHSCSGCFRLEHFAGWDFHPLEKRRLCTAHTGCGRSIFVSHGRQVIQTNPTPLAGTKTDRYSLPSYSCLPMSATGRQRTFDARHGCACPCTLPAHRYMPYKASRCAPCCSRAAWAV